ncbi:strictosidine synthase [Mesorhizobium sp. M7D.F.Ca.US.005.01.1.1]|uniref:strictosidine synthase n=1 Tax=Mesorhizobium sp. M7D.F.Ca.US.005.01.1.1 TaxID=2493678 RepID=UPI000F750859|nr:strictosidine synthase [Mesorhizobium sp. M7D.F.Ca.US.005.01.1.1]AZO41636.1 strictosidine synthase [Mesorhizobium sp. M7D.F.Ca.US.005.01.1.1]
MSMSGRISSIFDKFMGGRGDHSITVPVMDGALKPNNYLERISSVSMIDGADNLAIARGQMLLTSGNRLVELHDDGSTSVRSTCDAEITFLSASPQGALALGLDNLGIAIVGGRHDGKRLAANLSGQQLNCPTAAVFLDEDTLVVCNGSSAHSAHEWSRDLLNLGRSGSVVRIDLGAGNASLVKGGLGFPSGVTVARGGKLVISEAWKHRLLALDVVDGSIATVLADLPAYPGRIQPASQNGYWLTMFAVRSQLQEFVLRENRYRREMMETIAPEYWIAPTLSSGRSFKEPLQSGSVIRLGIHKPWAPSRSYGLLLRLDDSFQPIWSAHSRADGRRHGITSCVEIRDRLFIASKGRGEILALDHLSQTEPDDLSVLMGSAA